MGKFSAKIILKQDSGSLELSFNFDVIEELSTRTMATNNPTQPVFDVFANQGTLVLKDKNLDLYNKAINGVFDNSYQFEVLLYKGDVLLAKHIINSRPYYDFANKTLTLSLGNSIDSFVNVLYEGFEYPLKPKEIQVIQSDILQKTLEGKNSYIEYKNLSNKKASVPYLPEMSTKQALTKTLETIGCSMIETPIERYDKSYKLVDMLGRETEGKVYKLLPKHTRKSFVPNIILDNRFSDVGVNATNLYTEVLNKTIFNVLETVNDEKITNVTSLVSFFRSNIIKEEIGNIVKFGELLVTKRQYYEIKKIQSIYQNLEHLLKIEKDNPSQNENPTITIFCEKTIYKNIENIGKKSFLYNSSEKKVTVEDWGLSDISNNLEDNTKWEKISDEIKEFGRIYYPSFIEHDLLVEGDVGNYYGENIFKIEDGNLEIDTKILIGLEYYKLFPYENLAVSTTVGSTYSSFTPVIEKVIYKPISVNITYNGIVKEIKLDETVQIISTENNINKFETTKGNELVQTNLDGSDNSIAKLLQQDLFNFYKDGIRTGDINVIFSNYVSTDGTTTKDIDTPFEVGDYVVPCKDNQGTPIITKLAPLETVTETNKTGWGFYPDTDYYYWEKTIETDFKILSIEKVIYGSFGKDAEVKKISDTKLKIICFSYAPNSEIDVSVTLKLDKKITPVYKVVDCEIDLDGGAGLQRLKLMENPNIILEGLSIASEPAMAMSLDGEMPLKTEISESKDDLSNEKEKGNEMSTNGLNDLFGL